MRIKAGLINAYQLHIDADPTSVYSENAHYGHTSFLNLFSFDWTYADSGLAARDISSITNGYGLGLIDTYMELSSIQYRHRFHGDTGVVYRVNTVHIFTPEAPSVSPAIIDHHTDYVKGADGWLYTPPRIILPPDAEGQIDVTVLKVELFKDNTTWISAAELDSPPVHLFTGDVIGGIEVTGPGSATVQAQIWISDDAANTETITLTETSAGSGIYRNTGTDVWPHFWKDHDDANKRLKVIDEDGKLHVIPIIDGTEVSACEKSEKVDAAEVAAVDGTDSLDAAEVYGDLTGGVHPWCGIALYDLNNSKSAGTGAKCVELGGKVDLLNVSGHRHVSTGAGITEQTTGGYGLTSDNFDPSDIGTSWDDGELEYCLLAVCNQVAVTETGPQASDFGIIWIKAMPKVHALLGYRLPAPTAGVDVGIANDFCARLAPGGSYDDVHMAWMLANRPSANVCVNRNASCLVNVNNLADKMYTLDKFPTKDDPGNQYKYFWIKRNGNPITGYTYQILYTTITLP